MASLHALCTPTPQPASLVTCHICKHVVEFANQQTHQTNSTRLCRHICAPSAHQSTHSRHWPPVQPQSAPHIHHPGRVLVPTPHTTNHQVSTPSYRRTSSCPTTRPSSPFAQGPDRDFKSLRRTPSRSAQTGTCSRPGRRRSHSHGPMAQNGEEGSSSAPINVACASECSRHLPLASRSPTGIPPALPMVHQPPTSHRVAPSSTGSGIILCPQCYRVAMALPTAHPDCAGPAGPLQPEEYQHICQRFLDAHTPAACTYGTDVPHQECPHHPPPPRAGQGASHTLSTAALSPAARAEDFALLHHHFAAFISAARRDGLPLPTVDAWGCIHQHRLPSFCNNFFSSLPELSRHILFINCRFSALMTTIELLRSHHCNAYMVIPHWPQSPWWPIIAQDATWTYTIPQTEATFLGIHQHQPLPCPWTSHIIFVCYKHTTTQSLLHSSSTTTQATTTQPLLQSSAANTHEHKQSSSTHQLKVFYQTLTSHNYQPPRVPGYFCAMVHHPHQSFQSKQDLHALPLAPIVTSSLSYEAVLQLAESLHFPHISMLKDMFTVLQCERAFHHICTQRLEPSRGKASHLPPARLAEALQYGILEKASTRPLMYHTVFQVLKGDGLTTRLVQAPILINDQMKRIWPCHFTPIHVLISIVCSWTWAIEMDAQSFYYQFNLHPNIRRWFGVRQPAMKSTSAHSHQISQDLVMTKMPQGWGPSAPIAQLTSMVLTYGLGQCHVDNYGIGGDTPMEVHDKQRAFLSRCKSCNVVIKHSDDPPTPTQSLAYMGLDFDLQHHTYRQPLSWCSEATTYINWTLSVFDLGYPLPLRLWWRAFGLCIWTAWVRQITLGKALWSTLRYMSRVTGTTKSIEVDYDALKCLTTAVATELRHTVTILANNSWLSPPRLPPSMHQCRSVAAMDSSEYAAAWLYAEDINHTSFWVCWWQWPATATSPRINMPKLEGMAQLRCLQDIPDMLEPVLWLTDCLPTQQAIDRGYSSSAKLNAVIQAILDFQRNMLKQHIPTKLMPADDE